VSAAAASELARALASGTFVLTAELSPPVSTDPAAFVASAQGLRGLATAVNVTDGASAKAHLSSLAAAHFLVLQMTCRDRNRIALQGDLLGAVALGIRNVLCLRGDDPSAGDQPETKPVFDVGTTAVLSMAHRMRTERRLPSGATIDGAVPLVLGAAETPLDLRRDHPRAGGDSRHRRRARDGVARPLGARRGAGGGRGQPEATRDPVRLARDRGDTAARDVVVIERVQRYIAFAGVVPTTGRGVPAGRPGAGGYSP
jgi:hypothetical protein